jgi:hypothetical protein
MWAADLDSSTREQDKHSSYSGFAHRLRRRYYVRRRKTAGGGPRAGTSRKSNSCVSTSTQDGTHLCLCKQFQPVIGNRYLQGEGRIRRGGFA